MTLLGSLMCSRICRHAEPSIACRSDGAAKTLQPLPEPALWSPLQGCLEDALTPNALLHGYRHSVAGAVGFTPHRELALTLTDQPPAFYSSTSLSYWRKVGLPPAAAACPVLPPARFCPAASPAAPAPTAAHHQVCVPPALPRFAVAPTPAAGPCTAAGSQTQGTHPLRPAY